MKYCTALDKKGRILFRIEFTDYFSMFEILEEKLSKADYDYVLMIGRYNDALESK